jgi:arginine:ornithine antiporter/lysine permease
LVAAYALKLTWKGETYEADSAPRRRDLIFSTIAVIYATWLVIAGGPKFLLLSAVIYGPGTVLFLLARREQRAIVFTAAERIVFAAAAVAAIVAIIRLASGSIAI